MADQQGIVARTIAVLRYAATGVVPGQWFGPGIPPTTMAPPEVKGRQFDYPTAINLNYQPRAGLPISFAKLKQLADASEILRIVMERQKELIKGQEWRIKERLKPGEKGKEGGAAADIEKFLQLPDQTHDWSQWLNGVLEQVFVYDALSVYGRPTLGGDLFALEVLDGSTITPLVDQSGRRPQMPDVAYEQILKGIPAAQFTTEELLYYPQNYRVDRLYGYSRVEQIITYAEQSLQRMKSQLGYFTHGNIGDGYFTAPEGYVPEQVLAIEKNWNDLMKASPEGRRQLPFLPHGTLWNATKADILADAFDEWLTRIICFVFGVSPTPFLKQQGLGHGSAQTDQEAATQGGFLPMLQYVQRLMNRILDQFFQRPDLEFSWVMDSEVKPDIQSQMDQRAFENGLSTINEIRDATGKDRIEGGDIPVIKLGNTLIPVASLAFLPVEPEEPETPETEDAAPKPDNEQEADEVDEDPLKKAANPKAEARLARLIARYFKVKSAEYAESIAADLGLQKAAMDEYSGRIESALESLDWDWSPLARQIETMLAGVAVAAGTDAVSEFDLFDKDTLKRMTARAVAYAVKRGAALVGMSKLGDTYVPNPDGRWSIVKTTRDMLRSLIAGAMEAGASNDSLAAQIRASTAFDKARAINIARTETAMADLAGQHAGWKETGLVGGKQWSAAPDCCDECQTYDGTVVAIDDEFPWGDLPHPSCRCDTLPVLIEDMPA